MIEDIDAQNQLLEFQNDILSRLISGNNDYQMLLIDICHKAESLVPERLASLLMFNDTAEQLEVVAAPSIPTSIVNTLDGLKPALDAGSCAHAVFSGEPTYVPNTTKSPCWASNDAQSFVAMHKIIGCWSQPVFIDSEKAQGSFALSSFKEGEPNGFQQNLLRVCAQLVSIIYKHKQQSEKLWKKAHHDALTGLPNRLLFEEQLEHAMHIAKRNNNHLALLYFDMDNFKRINDTHGHDFGDNVLMFATDLIQQCLREGDIVSRIGGDEFIVLLENLDSRSDAEQVAEKILNKFSHPLRIGVKTVTVQFSIGMCLFPEDGNNAEVLTKRADIAMYHAKNQGRNNIQYFEQSLEELINQQAQIEQDLEIALLENQLELYYQPEYISESNEIDSIEVLLRWNHPEKGLIYPDDFLPVAEQSSLINQISLFVVENTCLQGAAWLKKGYELPRLAINFSIAQLTEFCAERLTSMLEKTQMPAEYLEFELKESLLIKRGQIGIDELNKMRSLGIILTMDDFGSGLSSINQLKSLPMNKVKIDGSIVRELEKSQEKRNMVKVLLSMGKNLGFQMVGEEVETHAQQQFLLDHGCDLIQGDLRHKPVSANEIEKLFAI